MNGREKLKIHTKSCEDFILVRGLIQQLILTVYFIKSFERFWDIVWKKILICSIEGLLETLQTT